MKLTAWRTVRAARGTARVLILPLGFCLASCGGTGEPTVTVPVSSSASGAARPEASATADGASAAPARVERTLLGEGARAPDILLPDDDGNLRTLSEHRGRPVVLYFYPRDATPGCTTEACAFRDAWSEIEDTGAVIYGVSTDSVASHRAFKAEHELPFALVSDEDGTALERFGVSSTEDAADRVTFLVGPDGRVARVFPDVDPGVHAQEVIEALEAVEGGRADRARIAEAVAAPDRSDADQALDAGRMPVTLLSFLGVREGMRVAELFAGTGYTAELLARVVGPGGKVYAQNNAFVLERFAAEPWERRLDKQVMRPVVRVDRELDDPLPESARGLDLVIFNLAYHDAVWMGTDQAAMNRHIFEALRPGGRYAVIDHAAAEGRGVDDAKTLHRIERDVVVKQAEAAGFELDEEAFFYANPDDAHDWNAAPSAAGERRGTSDRFVLVFERPAG